jgi:hypothetical protein
MAYERVSCDAVGTKGKTLGGKSSKILHIKEYNLDAFQHRNCHSINSNSKTFKPTKPGRAIAQGVSRWLPTAAARVQTRI